MPRACNLIRPQPWYRRDAFDRGLTEAGYDVQWQPFKPQRGDVLLIWNRYGARHEQAKSFEGGGGTVLVCENGIIGAGGTPPKFDVHPRGPEPHHYYSIAKHYHNGRGEWQSGGKERWDRLGITIKPRRPNGEHILICPNRSFGVPPAVMPQDWAERTTLRLKKETDRDVRIRRHPGNNAPARPLAMDLAWAHAVVVWSSNVAVHSIVEGIPTYIEAPWQWIKSAGASGSLDKPVMPDPMPALVRAAWAQWTVEEIESGEPFRHLLSSTRKEALV